MNGDVILMDKEKFSKIKAAYEKNGGVMVSSSDVDRHLDKIGAEAATLNKDTILIRSDRIPTASAIFEELIHTAQHKNGRVKSDNWVDMEIEAKTKLVRNKSQYGITDLEHQATIKQLESLGKLKKEGE